MMIRLVHQFINLIMFTEKLKSNVAYRNRSEKLKSRLVYVKSKRKICVSASRTQRPQRRPRRSYVATHKSRHES